MKGTCILSSWLLITMTLLATVCISESNAVVIPMPIILPNNGNPPPYVVIRSSHNEDTHNGGGGSGAGGTTTENAGPVALKRRGDKERTGYVPGGTGSGNQYDKGKPYGRRHLD